LGYKNISEENLERKKRLIRGAEMQKRRDDLEFVRAIEKEIGILWKETNKKEEKTQEIINLLIACEKYGDDYKTLKALKSVSKLLKELNCDREINIIKEIENRNENLNKESFRQTSFYGTYDEYEHNNRFIKRTKEKIVVADTERFLLLTKVEDRIKELGKRLTL
jgi:hypothetical protein